VTRKEYRAKHALGLDLVWGPEAWTRIPTAGAAHLAGASGVAAARWAIALGFSPIYLLGCDATMTDKQTHFYGHRYTYSQATMGVFAEERDTLLARHGNLVRLVTTGDELRRAVTEHAPRPGAREHIVKTAIEAGASHGPM